MANYPVSVYAPSTHNTGDIIQAADVNNPNAEIVAIEQDLVNGALRVNLIPNADVTKSIGSASFRWQNFYSAALQALDISSRVNYLVAKAAATAGAPSLQSSGTDATVNLLIGTLGGTQLKLVDVASIVNFIQISGRATGGVPDLAFTGSDATVGGTISTKGGTAIKLIDAASLANYAKLIPAAAGTRVQYTVDGSDTNIDLDLVPKGTGSLRVNNGSLLLVDGANQGRISTNNANRTRMLQSMVRAERTSAQSVANVTWTPITFQSASVNTDSMWASGAPTRVTAQITGKYLVVGGATFGTSAAGVNRLIAILKNSNGIYTATNVYALYNTAASISTATPAAAISTGPIVLNANDYLELFVYQDSGGALNVGAQQSMTDTFLSLLYVGE